MNTDEEPENIIFQYTSQEAEEDGILFNVERIDPKWKEGLFNFVTVNLLKKCGYLDESDNIKIPCIVDLLQQALNIVKNASKDLNNLDDFYSGAIELPSGDKTVIWIEVNETGRMTLLLPEDH